MTRIIVQDLVTRLRLPKCEAGDLLTVEGPTDSMRLSSGCVWFHLQSWPRPLRLGRHSHSASDTLRPFLITMLPVWAIALAGAKGLLGRQSGS